MLYSYIALNTENQKLKGVIAADSEILAKKKLHQVGLSVLSLRETNEEEESLSASKENKIKSLPSFTFFVIDPQGKQLSGSIEAVDRKNALKRLAEEYGFEILSLCENSVPEDLRYKKGIEGLKDLEDDLEDEFGINFKHSKEGKQEQEKNEELYDETFQEERKEILKEIELVSKKTQEILKKYQSKIPVEEYDEISHLLGQLNRMRFSNNFQLIRKLIEDLFIKIDDSMKHHIIDQNTENYEDLLQEQENLEDIISKGGTSHKDVLSKLKKASSSLDKFLGETFSTGKKKNRKKNTQQEHIFTEVEEDFYFFRRIIRNFLQAFFTQNSSLKKERMNEVKKKIELWKKIKHKKEEKRRAEKQKKQLELLKKHRSLTKEAQVILWIVDEIYTFLGALLFILFGVGYGSFLFQQNNIALESDFLMAIVHSEIIPKLSIITFFLFTMLALRKKFFEKEIFSSFIFIFFMSLIYSLYFYNL